MGHGCCRLVELGATDLSVLMATDGATAMMGEGGGGGVLVLLYIAHASRR